MDVKTHFQTPNCKLPIANSKLPIPKIQFLILNSEFLTPLFSKPPINKYKIPNNILRAIVIPQVPI